MIMWRGVNGYFHSWQGSYLLQQRNYLHVVLVQELVFLLFCFVFFGLGKDKFYLLKL